MHIVYFSKKMFLKTLSENFINGPQQAFISWRKTRAFRNGFRKVIFIGKILGVIRIDAFGKAEDNGFKVNRKVKVATLFPIIMTIHTFLYCLHQTWRAAMNFSSQRTIIKKLEYLQAPFFGASVFSIYAYFLWNSARLKTLIQKWESVSSSLISLRGDRRFPRFCTTMIIVVLGSSIVENILYDVQYFAGTGRLSENASILEQYYWRSGNIVTTFLPYSAPLAICTTILSKLSTYAWNFSDIVTIVWCRALTDRFKAYNEHISTKLTTLFMFKGNRNSIYASEGIRTDFQTLLQLNEHTAGFLSPLLIICYCYNIYLMILNIFRWLDPRGTGDTEHSAYIYVSFLQFSLRVILVTYYASQVNHSTFPIERSLERIPDELYTQTVERLEKQLSKHPVGISLFGTFCITRYFFISIISFLFTTEIVLLQTINSGGSPSDVDQNGMRSS